MANDALLLDRIEAYYGDSHVLHQVSFALGEGAARSGLLGRNGAGKTTSMNVAIGLVCAARRTGCGPWRGRHRQFARIDRGARAWRWFRRAGASFAA